jgi:hypothetical protein
MEQRVLSVSHDCRCNRGAVGREIPATIGIPEMRDTKDVRMRFWQWGNLLSQSWVVSGDFETIVGPSDVLKFLA